MKWSQASILSVPVVLMTALFLGNFGDATAGFEPMPFQPEINKLGAAENQLVAAKKRLAKTMDKAAGPEGPSKKLKSSLKKLDSIDRKLVKVDDKVTSIIEEVMGVEPSPFHSLTDIIPAMSGLDSAAAAIVDEIDARLGTEPSPFLPEFEDRLQLVRDSALTTSTRALKTVEAITCAQGATDKVMGTYTRANCNDCQPGDDLIFVAHRQLLASEARGALSQTGFMFSSNDADVRFELDFTDTYNTCVNIYADGRARIAGVVTDGNGPQVERVFGFHLEDHGWPAYFSDKGQTVRFALEYNSEDARQYAHYWCETGELLNDQALEGYAVWPGIVIDGDLVICNTPTDGD